ncbi:hypothetical protein FMUND_15310 [Fusarium mundagurra]|uniref:Uncharacterized protein n=1 Tax=Fusarium mundagurra TaxID=1567541 RepID=A0A8H5XQQ9_9HYPO|nr:hypothetical protein FMUND_15310 [Fusarium mundagurra]
METLFKLHISITTIGFALEEILPTGFKWEQISAAGDEEADDNIRGFRTPLLPPEDKRIEETLKLILKTVDDIRGDILCFEGSDSIFALRKYLTDLRHEMEERNDTDQPQQVKQPQTPLNMGVPKRRLEPNPERKYKTSNALALLRIEDLRDSESCKYVHPHFELYREQTFASQIVFFTRQLANPSSTCLVVVDNYGDLVGLSCWDPPAESPRIGQVRVRDVDVQREDLCQNEDPDAQKLFTKAMNSIYKTCARHPTINGLY